MYDFQTLKSRADGAVLFVEIDSPPMNLLGKTMVADLVSLIRILDKGEPHRVVVFSSAHPDFLVDSDLFGEGVKLPVTQALIRTLFQRGMQKPEDLELNFGRALGELAD
jgi:hypothetical protein